MTAHRRAARAPRHLARQLVDDLARVRTGRPRELLNAPTRALRARIGRAMLDEGVPRLDVARLFGVSPQAVSLWGRRK